MVSRLRISVILPEDSAWNQMELTPLVDDLDMIEAAFDRGPRKDPDTLLGPDSRLLPGTEPHEVMLAEAECTWGCCGGIFVRVYREGGQVVWDRWRNPDDSGLSLAVVRFELAQYEAELARAHRERSWEWPGRTVARLLRDRLLADADVLGRWNSGIDWAHSLPDTRDQVDLTFTSPPRHVVHDHWKTTGQPLEHDQFRIRFPVSAEPAHDQAERIVAGLRGSDPRGNAERCGGYVARR